MAGEIKKIITFIAPAQQVEILSDELFALGALAIDCHAADQDEVFQVNPDEHDLWQNTLVKALFEDNDTLSQALIFSRIQAAIKELTTEAVPDTDWVSVNQQQFQPICFADKLWVCPSWHDAESLNGVVLKLDPGIAFGTGTHPTTAMCLEYLAKQDLAGKTLVDFGCGSGILAIAAALLGAKAVLAIDHDQQAIKATEQNAKHNQVEQIQVTKTADSEQQYDLVVANILANPLIELSPIITKLTKPHGYIILSGLLENEATKVIAAYQDQCQLQHVVEQDEWALVVLQKQA